MSEEELEGSSAEGESGAEMSDGDQGLPVKAKANGKVRCAKRLVVYFEANQHLSPPCGHVQAAVASACVDSLRLGKSSSSICWLALTASPPCAQVEHGSSQG